MVRPHVINEVQNENNAPRQPAASEKDQKPSWKRIFTVVFGIGFIVPIFSITTNGYYGFVSDAPALLLYPFAISLSALLLISIHTLPLASKFKRWLWVTTGIICVAILIAVNMAVNKKEETLRTAAVAYKQEHDIISNTPAAFKDLKDAVSNLPKAIADWQTNGHTKSIEWQPEELPEGCERVFVQLGGNYFSQRISRLTNENAPPFAEEVNGKTPVRWYVRDNRFFVDVDIPVPISGQIRIRGNKVSQISPEWDWNHNSVAIEIVNESNIPVYQVIHKKPDVVEVLGTFVFGRNVISYTEDGEIGYPITNGIVWPTLKPIFKYPAWRHPGEYAGP